MSHTQGKSDLRYCFTVVWYDTAASLQRKYQLIYYTADGTVEMVRHRHARCSLAHAGTALLFSASLLFLARRLMLTHRVRRVLARAAYGAARSTT